MRPWFWLALSVLLVRPAGAQQHETLMRGDLAYGGFGGPVAKLTVLDGTLALLVGGRGGWILNVHPNHTLVLGGGGYGLVTQQRVAGVTRNGAPMYLTFGYGGVELEYVNRTRRLLHPSVQVLIGGGGVGFREDLVEGGRTSDLEPFFVAEPGAQVMLNVTDVFRIGLGASYRLVHGVRLPPISTVDLSHAAGVLSLKIGRF